MTTIVAAMDKNTDLVDLQNLLSNVLDQLVAAQENATDPDTIRTLGTEIREVGFRATNVQQLLFKEQTAEISEAVDRVKASDAQLKAEIADIERLNNFIDTVSAFLGLVDKVVDLAKLI